MAAHISVVQTPAPDPWWSMWERFERSLRAEGASRRTLDAYHDAATLFHDFLMARSYPLDATALEKRHVEEFLIHLREEREAKPATVRNRFSALRRFFNFLLEEDEIEHSPMARVRGSATLSAYSCDLVEQFIEGAELDIAIRRRGCGLGPNRCPGQSP